MPAKLTDVEIAQMRALRQDGESVTTLAKRFGVSRSHASRVLGGRARPQLGESPVNVAGGNVVAAVESYLDGLTLDEGQQVLAETARVLAIKLDSCRDSDTSGSASAAPALAKELQATMDALRGLAQREPSPLDLIRARRDARVRVEAGSIAVLPGRQQW